MRWLNLLVSLIEKFNAQAAIRMTISHTAFFISIFPVLIYNLLSRGNYLLQGRGKSVVAHLWKTPTGAQRQKSSMITIIHFDHRQIYRVIKK